MNVHIIPKRCSHEPDCPALLRDWDTLSIPVPNNQPSVETRDTSLHLGKTLKVGAAPIAPCSRCCSSHLDRQSSRHVPAVSVPVPAAVASEDLLTPTADTAPKTRIPPTPIPMGHLD